ncbi:MAG: matrixin family metalloprotease [Phycisphaerales bacterium]
MKKQRALVMLAGLAVGSGCALGEVATMPEPVMGSNGYIQAGDLKAPDWIVDVITPDFDASFQDTRTQQYIHSEVSRVIADGRYIMFVGDPEVGNGPSSACFAPDSNPDLAIINAVNNAILGGSGEFGERYLINGTWQTGQVNAPRAITWSFVPDGLSIPSGVGEPAANSTLFATFDAQFANNGGRATWIAKFEQIFARWSALSGLSYVRRTAAGVDWDDGASWTSSGGTTRGDVRIASHPIDGANGILAYNAFPGGGAGGNMVIDSQDTWDAAANDYRFLRNTLGHEHGHGIGLLHVCPILQTKLMEPFLTTAFDGPQQDDLRGAQYNYGDTYEPNSSSSVFYDMGTLADGSTTTLGTVPAPAVTNGATASIVGRLAQAGPPIITAYQDQDWHRMTLAAPRLMTFSVNRVGSSYVAVTQSGPCNETSPTQNTAAVADLKFMIYRSDGTTQLANIDATVAGSNESQANILIPAGNSFFVVTSDGIGDGVQLYNASATVNTTSISPTATDNLFTDRVRISWPTIANAANYRVHRATVDNFASSSILTTEVAPTTLYNDTTAVPGVPYFYWVSVNQTFNSQYITTTVNGEPGMRAVPPNVPPIANAGSDQTVTDSDNSGSETVTLNGTGSSDSDGTITSYVWKEGVTTILTGATGNVSLPVGTHTIQLTVTDNATATATDNVVITVNAGGGPVCDSIDFNNDTSFFDPQDIDAFLSVYGEGPCIPASATCNDIDFNNDSSVFDPCDIDSFLTQFAEGPCTPCGV